MVKEKKVELVNKTGLHARPASLFVQKANNFKSDIKVEYDGKEVNAKSILSIMGLGAGCGAQVTIKADGEDAEEAVKELVDLIENEMPKEDQESE